MNGHLPRCRCACPWTGTELILSPSRRCSRRLASGAFLIRRVWIGANLVLAVTLAACAGLENINLESKDTGVQNVFKGIKAANRIGIAALPISDEKEIQIGQVVAARVAAKYPVWENAPVTKYVNLLGQALAHQSGRTEIPYHFAVLDSDEINAFAAPGGYIFINRGTIKAAKNEAELAGVLAHEISHVAERQIVKALRKQNITTAVAKSGEDYLKVGGEMFEAVANAASDMVFRGLDRTDELDADRRGTDIAARVGYAPGGLKQFLEVIKAREAAKGKAPGHDLGATHPKPSDRIAQLGDYLKKEGLAEDAGPTVTDRFHAYTAAAH